MFRLSKVLSYDFYYKPGIVTDNDARKNSGMDAQRKANRKGKLPMLINLNQVNVEDYKKKNNTSITALK